MIKVRPVIMAIIQARVRSTRLPGKVFALIEGKPLLSHVVERLRISKKIKKIIIATSTHPADNRIISWARHHDLSVFRGSENDVLSRYYHAARQFAAATIVRITADDPFKDPQVIDRVIRRYLKDRADFACNNRPPTYPEGLDVEVFSFAALERIFKIARSRFDREHVTPYFYRHPRSFRTVNIAYRKNLSHLRWTLDTKEDLRMTREVYAKLYRPGKCFGMNEILRLIEKEPSIAQINRRVARSYHYRSAKNRGVTS